MKTSIFLHRGRHSLCAAALSLMVFASLPAMADSTDQVARYFAGDHWVEFAFDDTEIMHKGETPPHFLAGVPRFSEEPSPVSGWSLDKG